MTRLLLYLLLWSLVDSQTVPYVSFRGETPPNHGYVDLSLVGTDTSDPGNTVRCHTDLQTCCSSVQDSHHGDWYLPNEERVGISVKTVLHQIFLRLMELKELTYFVGMMLSHHLEYITVRFLPMRTLQ